MDLKDSGLSPEDAEFVQITATGAIPELRTLVTEASYVQKIHSLTQKILTEGTYTDYGLEGDEKYSILHINLGIGDTKIVLLERIILREELRGIKPPREGLEITMTVLLKYESPRSYPVLSIFDLSNGKMVDCLGIDGAQTFFVYRGHLLVQLSSCGLLLIELEDGKISYKLSNKDINSNNISCLDHTTSPPTILSKIRKDETEIELVRLGNITQVGKETFEFEEILSLQLPEHRGCSPYDSSLWLYVRPEMCVDFYGRIWIAFKHNEIAVFSPDFQLLRRLEFASSVRLLSSLEGEINIFAYEKMYTLSWRETTSPR